MKLGIISLGCAKNLVDSELILGLMNDFGFDITSDIKKADYIVVNTCGFIESAKEEAINTILDVCDYQTKGKKIIVTGCLVERYLKDLKKSIPEVDLYVPIKDYPRIGDIISNRFGLKKTNESLYHHKRILTTQPHTAYLRISDGCDHRCHYCAIPLIRGKFVSRPMEEIIIEAKELADKGVIEINLISQDTSYYGYDLKNGTNLVTLLKELLKIENVKYRMLYLYPDWVTDELIEFVKNNDRILPYFDVPIQHASNKILKSMNRISTKELMLDRFNKIRTEIPKAILRTTVIVGYPGETKEDYNELIDFIKKVKFDRLGCFTYSKEEDTVAYDLKPVVRKDVSKKRMENLMAVQEKIALERGKTFIGSKMNVCIEGYDFNELAYVGRSYAFAPDDVDGKIYVYSKEELKIGQVYSVEIVDNDEFNLSGRI